MVQFSAIIQKFDKQGDKTGWTYIVVPAEIAQQLKPNNKKAFRVKGMLDDCKIAGVSTLPMGDGYFMVALNAAMRKNIKKPAGAVLHVSLALDTYEPQPSAELLECLVDAPNAAAQFETLTKSHRNYFINYIASAKTDQTKARRIAQTINALEKKMDYGQMIRAAKGDRKELYG
ncbi:MAG: YdeI/OmpD-associated family protein [Chitinophagaceae bacterium]|nr:YdeI/OmpD-associated family protein [Chitinophagaceae bacterium]